MAHLSLIQFQLSLDKIQTKGEYEGNADSGKVIIFSHGFGVKRDSWGMFNELGDRYKPDYLVVRFDYTRILPQENATQVYPLSVQAKMLEQVIAYIREKFKSTEIDIIAHSQGCLVTGILSPHNIHKVILLASPLLPTYHRMIAYFAKREESMIDEKGISRLKRSDGSWTLVGPDFWQEVKTINPIALYQKLAPKTELYCVRALRDEVILDTNVDDLKEIKKLHYLELKGDHNFAGEARQNWLDKMVEIISKD